MITQEDVKKYNEYIERFNKLLLIFNNTIPSDKKLVTKELKPTKRGLVFWDGIYRAIDSLKLQGVTINCKDTIIILEARHCAMNFSTIVCTIKDGFLDQLTAKPFIKAIPYEVDDNVKQYYRHLEQAQDCKNRLPRPLQELI
jgi:hypothetical protein